MLELHAGDNRKSLRRLIDAGVRVHAVVSDPPYGLVSIQKRFGKENAKAARTEGNDGSFSRLSAGFMGKSWDATEIERDPEFWKLVYEILLPGGYCFAFSGARTGHWQACAMELAGFIMHPMHIWAFATGLPKGHEIKGVEGFEGWMHGTQTQKPALEPIYLAQKPFSEETGRLNVLRHGVGGFNIEGCMVPAEVGPGRYPSNLILDGSPEVTALFPDSKGQLANASTNSSSRKTQNVYGEMQRGSKGHVARGDSGSAARFFHQFPADFICDVCLDHEDGCEVCWSGAPRILYNAKAGKVDRAGSKHPTVKPIGLMQNLIRHVTPPGGIVLDPFAGSGTTGEAALREGMRCILMEAEDEYVEFLKHRFQMDTEGRADKWLSLIGL